MGYDILFGDVDEAVMISAKEAKSRSTMHIDIKAMAEIKSIEGMIIAACSEGDTVVTYAGVLTDKTINVLEGLGYEVEFENRQGIMGDGYNIYTISWDEED